MSSKPGKAKRFLYWSSLAAVVGLGLKGAYNFHSSGNAVEQRQLLIEHSERPDPQKISELDATAKGKANSGLIYLASSIGMLLPAGLLSRSLLYERERIEEQERENLMEQRRRMNEGRGNEGIPLVPKPALYDVFDIDERTVPSLSTWAENREGLQNSIEHYLSERGEEKHGEFLLRVKPFEGGSFNMWAYEAK